MARKPSKLRLARDALGQRVRVHRAKRGVSQTAFGVQAGTTQATVSAIELGKANPRLTTLASLAEALNLEVSELFVDPDREKT
jgi:transcriptional regulator with XRE-family HTH domain